ncbi:MAG: hypothetical protein MJK14_13100, partial [Rivularia sp. ALOHA_DT_140]|nr:hypothetical protein [Rivularia sp. ALOHA_DT_140]
SNYKGSGKRKIMRNDCQHHETQMGIRLESWELDPKWVLYIQIIDKLLRTGCPHYKNSFSLKQIKNQSKVQNPIYK